MLTNEDALPSLDHSETLILWNETSQKWQDVSNDFFCQKGIGEEKWYVRARNSFEPGMERTEFGFDTPEQAMEFFVNFLVTRRARLNRRPRIERNDPFEADARPA